jgi:cytochrome c oxidase assembly factor CtaG
MLFWWAILHTRTWGMLFWLVAADVVNTALSAFLAFCGRPVYGYYADRANPFGLNPLDDQVMGAVIMWVFGSMAFLIPAFFLTLRLLGAPACGANFPAAAKTHPI